MRTSTFAALVVALSSLATLARAFTLDLSLIDTNPSRVDGASYASATIEYLGIGTDGHFDALSIWQDKVSSYGVTVVAASDPLPGIVTANFFTISDYGFMYGVQVYGLGWFLEGNDAFLDALGGPASGTSTLEDFGWNVADRMAVAGWNPDATTLFAGDFFSGHPSPDSYFLAPTPWIAADYGWITVPPLYLPAPLDYLNTRYLVFGRLERIPDETDPNVTNWQITLYDGVKMTLDAHVEGAPVPEPATTLVLGAGALGAAIRRRKSR